MDDDQEVESSRISSPEDHNRPNDVEINGNHEKHDGYVVGLGRQTSIYSLTLDEFQHTICDQSGKSFGSMNMDEFLNSIWIAEENQNQQQKQAQANDPDPILISSGSGSGSSRSPKGGDKENSVIEKQPSFCLSRQGSISLSIPAPLSRKTVDEVWTQIQQEEEQEHQQMMGGSAQRQPTFGELTLEDFLVKAGVVREQDQQNCGTITPHTPAAMVPPQQQRTQYGLAPQLGPGPGPSPSPSPAFGGLAIVAAYQAAPATGVDSPGAKRNIGCPTVLRSNDGQPMGPRDGVRTGAGVGVGAGAVMLPVSPRPTGRMEVGTVRMGKKRTMDGPVEKVVERRQRRMIKNRESAARSRARKQAYTVELEAELNQLREENAKMKHILVEMKKKRKQQNVEQKLGTHRKGSMDQRGLRSVRRSRSCNL